MMLYRSNQGKINLKLIQVVPLNLLIMLSSAAWAMDQFLSKQTIQSPDLTSGLIHEIKKEAVLPIKVQMINQQSLAVERSDELKQSELEASAVNEYAMMKKSDLSNTLIPQQQLVVLPKNIKPMYIYDNIEHPNIIIKKEYPASKNLGE